MLAQGSTGHQPAPVAHTGPGRSISTASARAVSGTNAGVISLAEG